ncbi:MAG: DNA polymerase III subunit gamma/tau [Alphaproteobacteria bacterium]
MTDQDSAHKDDPVDPGPTLAGLDLPEDEAAKPYQVLARKYRPQSFADLYGQDALVRTLSNAISSGRIAHAFMFTGVRGVGKTTTARIIAKALNCIGEDGQGGPTTSPCGVCENCKAITEDRHVDVIEMDAASRTGINDIREIIEGVRYAPASARFKIYIIDEVHMLSTAAFNGLLKTLEEPPPHVKFIFATTEIRKVPVTVLSRCQRFDLLRIDAATLRDLLGMVVGKEGYTIEDEALALVARAADGSARDGLSILDQALSLSDGNVTAQAVRDMLGLADRERVFDLLDSTLKGDAPEVLSLLEEMHRAGAAPAVVLEDMLELTHQLTRLKLAPDAAGNMPEAERVRGGEIAAKLGLPALNRCWQILLKGLAEVQQAPNPQAAAEMVLIRLIHASDLPDPSDLIRKLQDMPDQPAGGGMPGGSGNGGGGAGPSGGAPSARGRLRAVAGGRPMLEAEPEPMAETAVVEGQTEPEEQAEAAPTQAEADLSPDPQTLREVAQLVRSRGEMVLFGQLMSMVEPVSLTPGKELEIRTSGGVDEDFARRLTRCLREWTGSPWLVTVSHKPATGLCLQDEDKQAKQTRIDAASEDTLIKALLDNFPGAKIEDVTPVVSSDE